MGDPAVLFLLEAFVALPSETFRPNVGLVPVQRRALKRSMLNSGRIAMVELPALGYRGPVLLSLTGKMVARQAETSARERPMSEEMKMDSQGLDPLAEKAAADDGRGDGKKKGRGKRKVSYLTVNKIDYVDYKDVAILRRFMTERGKILPSRQTGNSAKQQRMIARAIKRAREMALLPFVVTDLTDDGRMPRPQRSE